VQHVRSVWTGVTEAEAIIEEDGAVVGGLEAGSTRIMMVVINKEAGAMIMDTEEAEEEVFRDRAMMIDWEATTIGQATKVAEIATVTMKMAIMVAEAAIKIAEAVGGATVTAADTTGDVSAAARVLMRATRFSRLPQNPWKASNSPVTGCCKDCSAPKRFLCWPHLVVPL